MTNIVPGSQGLQLYGTHLDFLHCQTIEWPGQCTRNVEGHMLSPGYEAGGPGGLGGLGGGGLNSMAGTYNNIHYDRV